MQDMHSDAEQFLTYPSTKLVETVGAAVTQMESDGRGGTLELIRAAYHSRH
jgi:hypothetical protein